MAFTADLLIENGKSLGGFSLDIFFDPQVLEAVSVAEGDFLKQSGSKTLFLEGDISDHAITGVGSLLLGPGSLNDKGKLLSITFIAQGPGDASLRLYNIALSTTDGTKIPYLLTVPNIESQINYDVNGDGTVNILDLTAVAANLGKHKYAPGTDVNGDGKVDIFDLVLVSRQFEAAPSANVLHQNPYTVIQNWIEMAQEASDSSQVFKEGIANLKRLLASTRPNKTQLLSNYPNPFNPETWIPYRLATDAVVTLTIYNQNGEQVRSIHLGHQIAAVYETRNKAIYWDGRNNLGERVASGIYFYHLAAGDYTATRKMVILK